MRRIPTLAVFFLLSLWLSDAGAQILPSFGGSRVGTSGMQFLKIAPDAMSAGMGGAVHATTNDVASLYWNPAGMTHVDSNKIHVQSGYTSYFAGMNMSWAGAIYRKSPYRYWGLHVLSLNSGEMPVTTEFQPTGTGQTYSVNDLTVGLSYAQVLTDNFSFGLTGKFAYEGIASVHTTNVLFDFGFQYYVGWQEIRFSAGLNNFGLNVRPNGKLQMLSLKGPKDVQTFEEISAPAMFRVGLAKDFLKSKQHSLTGNLQLNHPTDNKETIGLGAEYGMQKLIYVRAGYEAGKGKSWPSLGFGVHAPRNFGNLAIDYSFTNRQALGNIHRITLGIQLIKQEGNH